MQTFTKTASETFHIVSCANCGSKFGICSQLHKRACLNADGHIFCPACGEQNCWRESESDMLRKQLRSEQDQLSAERARHDQTRAELQHTENRRRAECAAKTRIKNRVAKGVCPCCNRHFDNLQSHMETKHPNYSQQGDSQ